MLPFLRMLTTSSITKKLRVPRSTVEWYVREGLLKPASKTKGGHLRFDLKDAKLVMDRVRRLVRFKRMSLGKLYKLRLWEKL